MADYAAGEIERNGTKVPIFVDDLGRWKATVNGELNAATSRAQLEEKITKLTKRAVVKVSVPFIELDIASWSGAVKVRRGTATGIHSSNGNVLVSWTGNVREQFNPWGGKTVYGDLADDQLSELVGLVRAKQEAVKALAAFDKVHEITLKDVVIEAVDKAKQ